MKCRLLLCLVGAAALAQELPVKEPGEVIEGLPNLNALDPGPAPPARAETPPAEEQAAARLETARRKQVRWEKLARQGVLSRAEAESTVPEVGAALVRYQRAHLARMQAEWSALQARKAEPALVETAAAAVTSSRALLVTAEEQWLQTRLRFAQAMLERMRRLYAEKLISRNQVEKAQAALAALQAQTVPRPAP